MKRNTFINRLDDLKELHLICAETPKIEHPYDEYMIFSETRELIRQFPDREHDFLYHRYFHPSSLSFIGREYVENLSFEQVDKKKDSSILIFKITFIEEGTFLFSFSVNQSYQLVSVSFKPVFEEFYDDLAINKSIISLFLFALQKERLRLLTTNLPLKSLIIEQKIQLILKA